MADEELALEPVSVPVDDRPESPAKAVTKDPTKVLKTSEAMSTSSVLGAINWVSVGEAALEVLFTHSLSVRLANGTLTAQSASGAPAHLTFQAVMEAALMAYAGAQASVQVGNLLVTFTPFAAS